MSADTIAALEPAHQRARGAAELGFALTPRGTVLRHLYQQAPLRVLFPDPEPGDPPVAALVNTAGGLAGGDAWRVAAALKEGATATLTTPAAEKVYRSLGDDTRLATTLRVGPGATLEWVPQEAILFNRARLRRRLDVDLAPGARLLAVEALVFGRAARGERFADGFLHDAWRLSRDGRLVWADALRLDPPAAALDASFGFGGAGALGTLLYAAGDAAAHLPLLREVTGAAACPAAASVPRDGILLARWLGDARPVREGVGRAMTALRAAALGLPPRLPRLWT